MGQFKCVAAIHHVDGKSLAAHGIVYSAWEIKLQPVLSSIEHAILRSKVIHLSWDTSTIVSGPCKY